MEFLVVAGATVATAPALFFMERVKEALNISCCREEPVGGEKEEKRTDDEPNTGELIQLIIEKQVIEKQIIKDALEELKRQIFERKTELKAEGLSGLQQNKDSQVVGWVAQINELNEKFITNTLEELKKLIFERKTQLKAEGLSGLQRNKDPQVVGWVAQIKGLNEKESPGSTQKGGKAAGFRRLAPTPMD